MDPTVHSNRQSGSAAEQVAADEQRQQAQPARNIPSSWAKSSPRKISLHPDDDDAAAAAAGDGWERNQGEADHMVVGDASAPWCIPYQGADIAEVAVASPRTAASSSAWELVRR